MVYVFVKKGATRRLAAVLPPAGETVYDGSPQFSGERVVRLNWDDPRDRRTITSWKAYRRQQYRLH